MTFGLKNETVFMIVAVVGSVVKYGGIALYLYL
jgi:hypothetical protein